MSSRDSFPDLIFFNINMPLMNGVEALEVMRSHPKFKDLPVVCFTTSSSQGGTQLLPRPRSQILYEASQYVGVFCASSISDRRIIGEVKLAGCFENGISERNGASGFKLG
jgi:CheY-like chemotaxis protein